MRLALRTYAPSGCIVRVVSQAKSSLKNTHPDNITALCGGQASWLNNASIPALQQPTTALPFNTSTFLSDRAAMSSATIDPLDRTAAAKVRVASRLISPPWGINSILSGSPRVRPMGRTKRVPTELHPHPALGRAFAPPAQHGSPAPAKANPPASLGPTGLAGPRRVHEIWPESAMTTFLEVLPDWLPTFPLSVAGTTKQTIKCSGSVGFPWPRWCEGA